MHPHPGRLPMPDAPGQPSLECADECDDAPVLLPYCPEALLAGFVSRMASHGRCVSTALMLADREYAMWQLACARALEDGELTALAGRLFAYFE